MMVCIRLQLRSLCLWHPAVRKPDRALRSPSARSPPSNGATLQCRSKNQPACLYKNRHAIMAHTLPVPQPHKNRTGRFPTYGSSLSKCYSGTRLHNFQHSTFGSCTDFTILIYSLLALTAGENAHAWPGIHLLSSYEGYPLIIPCHDDLLSFLRWNMIWFSGDLFCWLIYSMNQKTQ